MRLKKLNIKNIRSYKNQEIEFPEGSLLLSGDIGSGKTSILLAIEYALFGLQPGQRGSSLLRNDSSLGEVSLEFEVDGMIVLLERRLKRSGKSVSNDYAAITIDGEKTVSSVTEIKTKIIQLLGYPSEFIKKNNILYRYTVYTPQENMKQIILEDSETRLNILRHVFGIDKYKRIRENLTIILNHLKEESKILEGEIKSLDKDKEALSLKKDLLRLLSIKIKEKEKELQENIIKKKEIEKEFLKLNEKIKEKEKFEAEVGKTSLLIGTKRENIASLTREEEEISRNLSEMEGKFEESALLLLSKKLGEIEKELEELNSEHIKALSSIKSLEQNKESSLQKKKRIFRIDLCPTCLQDVPEAHKHNIVNEAERELVKTSNTLKGLEKEVLQITRKIQEKKNEKHLLEKSKAKMEILKSRLTFMEISRKKLKEMGKIKRSYEKDITILSKHLTSLKENILEFSKFNNFLKIKQAELEESKNTEKNLEIEIAEFKKELELTNNEVAGLESFIEDKEKSKLKLSNIKELSDWLSNQFQNLINFTERNIMMRLRLEFSRLFSKWFHILVSSDLFEVHLDETFTPIIMQRGTEMDYSFLSGGERTAVALAYRLALNQTINSILSKIKTRDMVILDEPTDGFSDIQLDKIRDILDELDVNQLIIVSHEQKIESFVDNVLKLTKKDNGSFIESTSLASNIVQSKLP